MLIQGDCLEAMKTMETNSIDLLFCDLPYGTTRNDWDVIIPLDKLWEQYNTIIKKNEEKLYSEKIMTTERVQRMTVMTIIIIIVYS